MTTPYDPALAQVARVDDLVDRQAAIRAYLAEQNGARGDVPLLCHLDALQLAAMWDRVLEARPCPCWAAYRARLRRLAAGRDPWDLYPDAAGFWAATDQLALRLQAQPRNGATVTEAGDGRVRVTGSADYVDMWVALKAFFADKRGFDRISEVDKTKIPRTTNADVLQLAQIWDQCAARARTDIFGVPGAKADWEAMSAQLKQATTGADPTATFGDNKKLWKVSRRLALVVQVAAEQPPDVTILDALESTVVQLPGRLKEIGSWVVDEAGHMASGAANAAGDVAGGALSRTLGPLVKPLAIGAGVLGAAILASKLIEKRRARRAG